MYTIWNILQLFRNLKKCESQDVDATANQTLKRETFEEVYKESTKECITNVVACLRPVR